MGNEQLKRQTKVIKNDNKKINDVTLYYSDDEDINENEVDKIINSQKKKLDQDFNRSKSVINIRNNNISNKNKDEEEYINNLYRETKKTKRHLKKEKKIINKNSKEIENNIKKMNNILNIDNNLSKDDLEKEFEEALENFNINDEFLNKKKAKNNPNSKYEENELNYLNKIENSNKLNNEIKNNLKVVKKKSFELKNI